MRIALGIEYDGSSFHGWQQQPDLRTVQSCLTQAISRVANHDIHLYCAGRTDTGVHATGQVVHFDTDASRSTKAWTFGTNSHCTNAICVRWAKEVNEDFHARFSATARRYRYVICNHSIRPALMRTALTWYYRPLDATAMHEAAQYLVGENDFSSFRAAECQSNTPMRNIHAISVQRRGDLVIIDITANAFLHHMVRNIAGCLLRVGSGRHSAEWIQEILEARDRRLGAETAPAYGLYLVHVTYPTEFDLPSHEMGPIFLT